MVNTSVSRNRKNEKTASTVPSIPKVANPMPEKKIIERMIPRYD
jgi:hypothetical protein